MIVSRWLAWVLLVASILTAGALRQFHARTPTSPFLPAPVGSLLFFLVLILFLVFVRGWGKRQEIPYAGTGLRRVNLLAMIPLLIALMLEKWISLSLYGPLLALWGRQTRPTAIYNARYLLVSAVGLLVVSLMLLPLFRRILPLLRSYLAPLKRLPVAAAGIIAALLTLYGGLVLFFKIAGIQDVHLRWLGFGRATGLILAGQLVIAFAEELYYRGILQSELAFLLPSLGVARERQRLAMAVGLISTAFALEHFEAIGSIEEDGRRLLFIFASSLFLGALLLLMENLWFCFGCHLVLNLFVLSSSRSGAGLQFVDGAGRPVLDSGLYVFVFFILAFVVAYLHNAVRPRLRPRGRTAAAAS